MNQLFESNDIQRLTDWADLLELLSIGLKNPTRELAAALTDGSYLSDLSACLEGVSSVLAPQEFENARSHIAAAAGTFAAQESEELYHQINQEFTRLFISPRKEQMPLYESLIVHRGDKKTSMFINPTCMHAEQVYRKSGFPFPEKSKTPGDHIAIELRFIAFLLAQGLNGQIHNQPAALASLDAQLADFVSSHIKRWYHPFMTELSQTSAHPFYLLLAQIGLLLEMR